MDDHFLQTIDFVAFDTETTGLWAAANRVVEIGAVKFRLGTPTVERFGELIYPERAIPLEVVNVHGITDSMVKNADWAEPVLKRFFDFCGEDSIMIAHNAPFDISFVGAELDRAGMAQPGNRVLDTVDIYRKMHPGLESYSLLSLARHFKITQSQTHRALDDAVLVWKLFELASEELPYVDSLSALKKEFTRYSFEEWQGETRELPEQYNEIRVAIEKELRLEIVYRTEGRPEQTRVIRPMRSHWHRQRFYISAYCELVDAERMFRLDRIVRFSPAK